MPVLNSRAWLDEFIRECERKGKKEVYFIQCEALCASLVSFFPAFSPEELHYHLLAAGLFDPSEWEKTRDIVEGMDKSGMWELAAQEYKELQQKWNGPEAHIVLFPIRKARWRDRASIPKKNGAAVGKVIFLFLTPDLPREEVKALLAHEYNHVCWLDHFKRENHSLRLKEALVLEGIAEFAVKELYGEKQLAPWVGLYSLETAMKLWKKAFVSALESTDKELQHDFLYGKKDRRLPKWIGYCIGYHIVQSFSDRSGPFKVEELLQKSADEIIAGSIFHS